MADANFTADVFYLFHRFLQTRLPTRKNVEI